MPELGRVYAEDPGWTSEDAPLVSIVTLNWNGLRDTLACLSSLERVSYPNVDRWMVDNGSTDGSPEAVRAHFPDVRLVTNPTNLGFAAGFNRGIRAALESGADYVFVLNNDTVLDPDVVTWLMRPMQIHSDVGISVPKIVYSDAPEKIWSAGARWVALPPRVKLIGYGEASTKDELNQPCDLDYATGCAMLISRRTFETVGLFDEGYFMYQEDYDYSVRVRASGLRIRYEPYALVQHKVSQGLGENSMRKWYLWSESVVLFYRQHVSWVGLMQFIIWVAAREMVKGNLSILPAFWRGIRSGFTLSSSALRS